MSAGRSQLRVLYVITDLLTGGVPLHLYRLCRWMVQQRHRPEVFCLAPPGPVSKLLTDTGIEVIHGFARSAGDLRVVLNLAGEIRRRQPDVVHSFLFHANIASRMARAAARYPLSRLMCEIQTVEIERRWHLWVDGMTQRMCRCEIGNSPSVIEHLAAHAHIQPHRLKLVRGGIDPRTVDDAPSFPRRHWNLPESAPLAVWVGRLDPVKGLDELLTALHHINQTETLHLAIAGTGEYEFQVRQRIEVLNLGARVHLMGRRDDVASLLKAADLFVFPSYTEGLPNAVLEAMAARVPIITTDVPGCRDLITHERNGLLTPVRDPESLADAIRRLLGDRVLSQRLAAQARADLEAQWSMESTFTGYAELYRAATETTK